MLRRPISCAVLYLAIAGCAADCADAQQRTAGILQDSTTSSAVVLLFVASDCVVSDRYFPETLRLQREFAPRGVRFWWVYPNSGEKLATVQDHQRQYAAHAEDARLDPGSALTRLTGAHVTPEAAVLLRSGTGEWKTAYRGRIDDRYIHIGLERPRPQHHDLEVAIKAALAGKPVPPPGGPTVGCAIMGPSR